MSSDTSPLHWQSRSDSNGICWLVLDKTDSSANSLSRRVLEELDSELTRVLALGPRGLVIKSGKANGFVAGADVTEFGGLDTAAEGTEVAARAQAVFARIADFSFPTVAAINGFALGGGLELALACRYRVAVKGYDRNLGLPEVQLGIHPGFGGTVRSVELLGAPLALDLMLTGRSLSPVEAHSVGLVDRLSNEESLDEAAAEMIAQSPPRRRARWYLGLLQFRPLRGLLAASIRKRVEQRANRSHYPAPYAILDLWARYGARGRRAYAAEARSIGELLVSQTCRNLVRVFLLRERLRNLAPKSKLVERVHVVGAGVMGGDIAAWCALRGLTVTLQDRGAEYVEPALKRAKAFFERRLRAPGAAADAERRLMMDLEAREAGTADVVLEAIIEQLEAKQALFRELEPKMRREAMLASNTSSIRLEDMAGGLEHPERFIGLHFFNPVAQLPLVEVIHGRQTSDAIASRALSFVVQIGKLPLPCLSAPGFVVNRILTPYMLEALRAHEDGYALETIDAAAERFGMPTGPIELADRVGLDVALHVVKVLSATLDIAAPKTLEDKVQARDLGLKTGRGFYRYEKERPSKSRSFPQPDADLQDRLILALVNESVACFADGVVEDYDLLDAGAIFGTGFAPFRGGPIQYARQAGVQAVVARLEELATRYGTRFTPHPGWQRLAADS